MYIPFEKISNKARAWVYILSKDINNNIAEILEKHLIKICETWKSHGSDINSSFVIYRNRFVILFAEENTVSGCSIDSTNNTLRKKLNQLDIGLDSNSKIGIFINNKIIFNNRIKVVELIRKKEIKLSNKIINTTINNKKDYLNNWILDIDKSWLNNFI